MSQVSLSVPVSSLCYTGVSAFLQVMFFQPSIQPYNFQLQCYIDVFRSSYKSDLIRLSLKLSLLQIYEPTFFFRSVLVRPS